MARHATAEGEAMSADEKKQPRERGTGHMYEHRGVWYVQVRDRGSRERKSTGLRGREGYLVAKRMLKEKLGEIAAGKFRPGADRVRVRDLRALVLADYNLNGRRSAKRVAQCYSHLEEYFGSTSARDIPRRMSAYINSRREEGAANATIRNEVRALARGFRLAVRDELLVDRPVFPVVRATNVRTGFVDDRIMAKILAALPSYMAALAEFCYRTAWRRGEAAGLLWSDVDFSAGEIRLPGSRTKSGEPATFPFSADERLAALMEEQKRQTEAWGRERGQLVAHVFWRAAKGGAVPVGDCRKSWTTAIKAAGVPGLLLHDLRRSRARLWSQRGVPDRVGMALGHWATRSIYDRYRIVSDTDMREALKRAEEAEQA